jgi:hypothetical protein
MAGNPLTNPNWAPELADTVERLVGTVRDTATNRVVVVVRALVFGIVIGVGAIIVLTLGIIVGLQLLQRLVNIGGWIDRDSSVWVSYLVMAGIFLLAGALLMRQRSDTDAA